MSSRHDHRRRDRSWERDDRDKGRDRDRDRDRDRGRYSRRRTSRSRSRSPRRAGTDSRRPGKCYSFQFNSIQFLQLSHTLTNMIQIDVTTEEIGMRTGETGIPGSPVGVMSETDEMELGGGTERRTGIGMTGRRGKARRTGMQSPSRRGSLNGVYHG